MAYSSCYQDSNEIEGFRPEWYISTMIQRRDIQFWLETLEINSQIYSVIVLQERGEVWLDMWESGFVNVLLILACSYISFLFFPSSFLYGFAIASAIDKQQLY